MHNETKSRLIILSDLWGEARSEWVENYVQGLKTKYEITYYDCCALANIDTSIYTQEALHQQFVEGGIDRAVQKMLELEARKVKIIAFSIGGLIAWKFGLKTKLIESLYCVSSTRLRYETEKPNGRIKLFFGDNDPFKPKKEWFQKMNIDFQILPDKEHQFYTEQRFVQQLVNQILDEI